MALGVGDFFEVKTVGTAVASGMLAWIGTKLAGIPEKRRQRASQLKTEKEKMEAQEKQAAAEQQLRDIKRRAESPMILLGSRQF